LLCVAGEDNGNEQSCPGNDPSTESGSFEKPKHANIDPNVVDAVESTGAAGGTSEENDAQAAEINPEMETDRQPLMAESTAFSGAAEALLSAGNMQPRSPEVLNKKNKQADGGKKGAQKHNKNADSVSTAGTWEVTSSDDNSKKNIVLIRRHHTSGIPDTPFTVEEAASFQSQISCETTPSGTDERNFSCETDEGNVIQEQVASVSSEPDEGPVNTEAIDTACIKTDVTEDVCGKNVGNLPSTDDVDIAVSQTTGVRPKRRAKMAANREACRKSQRCISRRRDTDECVVTAPVSTVAAEAKTAGICEDARTAHEGNALGLVSLREEASQEHAMSSHISASINYETEPAASVSSSVINQTEVSMESCDPSVVNSSSVTAASVDTIVQPVASTEKSALASESMPGSQLSGLLNEVDARDSSEDQYPLNSTSHINNSACRDNSQPTSPIAIKQEVKVEQPWTNEDSSVAMKVENVAVKRESGSTSCSYLAADSDTSCLVSNDTSLLNTGLSGTFLESTVSPAEQLSHDSSVHSRAADRTDKEVENSGTPSTAVFIKTELSCEDESEEVCKMILKEVVAEVVKETCTTSASKENAESSSTSSSAHALGSASAQNESDSLSEEIPLKKRRGRRAFADRQPSDTVTSLPQSSEDRRDGISARSSSHRRKISGSSSRRRLPRGKKYVGAHTSVIGKLVPKCRYVV